MFARGTNLLLCIITFCCPAFAQTDNNWKVQYIRTEDGLSNRFVNQIIQDHRGYTWIATNFGLNRYDGQHIDVLTRESHGLSLNSIYAMRRDVFHHIWLIQRHTPNSRIKGVDILDPISFKVMSLDSFSKEYLPLSGEDVKAIETDDQYRLFILTYDGQVYKYDSSGLQKFISFPPHQVPANVVPARGFVSINFKDSDILHIYDPQGKMIRQLRFPDQPVTGKDLNTEWVPMGMRKSKENQVIWVNHYNEWRSVTLQDTSGFSDLQPARSNPEFFYNLGYTPGQNLFWSQDDGGLFAYDSAQHKKHYHKIDPGINAHTFFADTLGYSWIGTSAGVGIYRYKQKSFTPYLSNPDPIPFSCRGFAAVDDHIYVLTYNGNIIFHPATQTISPWPAFESILGLSLSTDHHQRIWMAAENGAIYRFIPGTMEVSKYKMQYTGDYLASWAIGELHPGEMWIGSTEGLWIKTTDNELPPVRFEKLNGHDDLQQSVIYHMTRTDEGIWLAGDKGLYLVDPEKGVLEHFDEKTSSLPNNNIQFVHVDKDGIFWMATRGGGLIRWDRRENTFKSFTTREGLSHNVIYAIGEDDFGFLWMSSDFGLMRFEKSTGICRTFLQAEGIPHEEFNRSSFLQDDKGNLYFGGLSGFVTFHPKDFIQTKSPHLPVQLTRFEAINEQTGQTDVLTDRAASGQEIRFGPNISSFLIHYSILDYEDPSLKRYSYRIDGLNSNWTYVKENFIRLNGLKGGRYTIRIKGQSTSGHWSENELVIPIYIMQPFLARWYSQFGILALLIGAIVLIYRRRAKLQLAKLDREKAISQQLRQVDKLKDQFLANTSHELRTPLNGIVGLSESLLEKVKEGEEKQDLELIIASGRRLSNLVNDILDFSRLKEHDLQLKLGPVDLHSIVDICVRINKQMITGKDLILENKVDTNISLCLADENRLQQILQNLIANAVKFTEKGRVYVDAMQLDGMILIGVADTGIGIPKEKQEAIFREFEQADGSIEREFGGTGLGLSITKYLVELHGGMISVVSEPGKGSTFSFTLPLYKGEVPVNPGNAALKNSKIEKEEVAHAPMAKTEVKTNGANETGHHILVVDDEPVNLKVLKNHLEREGYRVTLAHDGYEALQLIDSNGPFQLILLDVMMPRMSGYEVCQKLREKHTLAELPVIMVTAKNQIQDLVESLRTGANDYIAKPFSRDELLSRVKTQLDHFQIHEATNRFVPHEFINSLGRQSILDLSRGDMVERDVHVMFSDIRDYTSLAEEMTPRENFKFVNKLAGKVGPIVKQHHGMINQYLGDTIMMLYMDKPDDGVKAGIAIQHMIRDFNAKLESRSRKPIRLGIGLHSGPLIMGIIGDAGRNDAAVISDTVNTASRMEGLTKHFNVNFIISHDTLQKMDDPGGFHLRYLGKVQAKGKHTSLDVYECYDGDAPEIFDLKKSTHQLFKSGIDAYFNQDMMLARKYFDQVYQANPTDATAFGFLHRIHGYLNQGVPEGWTGLEVMTNK
jgi:signal transduction histidine kinase/CheY-like chemotaxis protein/class 3 adenylate cyclase/ligand-binding sensor domain-containing protein